MAKSIDPLVIVTVCSKFSLIFMLAKGQAFQCAAALHLSEEKRGDRVTVHLQLLAPRVSARFALFVDDHKHVGSVLSVFPKNMTECNNRLSTSKSAVAFFLWFFFFVQTPTSPRNESDALRPRSFDPVSFTRHILEVSTNAMIAKLHKPLDALSDVQVRFLGAAAPLELRNDLLQFGPLCAARVVKTNHKSLPAVLSSIDSRGNRHPWTAQLIECLPDICEMQACPSSLLTGRRAPFSHSSSQARMSGHTMLVNASLYTFGNVSPQG